MLPQQYGAGDENCRLFSTCKTKIKSLWSWIFLCTYGPLLYFISLCPLRGDGNVFETKKAGNWILHHPFLFKQSVMLAFNGVVQVPRKNRSSKHSYGELLHPALIRKSRNRIYFPGSKLKSHTFVAVHNAVKPSGGLC